jgi:hypothetical protein
MIPLWKGKNPIYFGVIMSKVKVTVTINIVFDNRGDLDLLPNDPKINMVLPLPQGNHVAKFGKDLIYRTKVIERKPVWTPPLFKSNVEPLYAIK